MMARISKVVSITLLALILPLGLAAGAAAQDGEAVVAITKVESQAFPQVTVFVAISDENGPQDGLTAADFRVSEDGVEVLATLITAEKDTSQELRLVLALDLSMNTASLSTLKEASKAFIDTLEPRDRVAVLAFYDEVRVIQDFTNNKKVLKATIEALTPEGNLTAFNEAALEAVTTVGALPTGRKAVLMLTNSADNASTHSADEVIDKARSVKTPIYTIGFDRIEPDILEAIATSTGGQPFILPNLDEIQNSFQTIGELLRQGGYKVTFQSGLKSDDAEHDLVIGVTYPGKEGQAKERFLARPGQVTVSLPDLAEGQTVGGVMDLVVQAKAPAPIASVEYQLNGSPLAEVTTPPYRFEWDSTTLEPDTYRLTVRVVDQAGNEGQAEVNLNVVRPVVVTASTSQTEVEAGDQVTVTAEVEALAEVSQVEFLLDGEQVGSDDSPPYRFSFDSEAYPAGEHLITVRAEDSLGQEAEASLTVQFAPVRQSLWLRLVEGLRGWRQFLAIGGVIAAVLAVVAIFIIGSVIIAKVQGRRRQKIYRLEISNLGNVHSRYELRAEDPAGALRFQFTLKGARLPQRSVPQVTAVTTKVPASSPTGPTRGRGREATGQALRTGSAIADVVSSVGAILPRSVGAPVQRVAHPMYQAQRTARHAARLPTQVGRAMPASSATRPQTTTVGRRTPTEPPPPHWVEESWAQTPFVASGETLRLDLRIAPLNPYQTQHYSFRVISRALEQENAPLMVEKGSVQVVGVSWFHRLLPYFTFATVVMVIAVPVMVLLLVNLGIWG